MSEILMTTRCRYYHVLENGLGECSSKLARTEGVSTFRSCRVGRIIHANHSLMIPANEPLVYCMRAVGAA